MRITYTAKRGIASGHSVGVSYNIDLYTGVPTPIVEPAARVAVAIDGTRETLLLRVGRTWQFTSDHFTRTGSPSTFDVVAEFLASVAGGEEFTFDPWRVPGGSSVAPVACVLEAGNVAPVDPGYPVFALTATVREVAAIT